MEKTTVILLIVTLVFISVYLVSEIHFFKILAITSATTLYHFGVRLLIGLFYEKTFKNHISWKRKWFYVGAKEIHLYKIIHVKAWKKYIPTYDSRNFDVKIKSYEEILMAMCQAELVHETIIVFSFLPIIASIWFGAMGVFIITSIVSACLDLIFVMVQRYNRPRVLKIQKAKATRKMGV